MSSHDDYLMNETRRKPTTGRQSPSLFDKWHRIFYMPSRIDEAGHTKAFDYPVAEHWEESQRTKRSLVGFEPTRAHTYESEIQLYHLRYHLRYPDPPIRSKETVTDARSSITMYACSSELTRVDKNLRA